MLNDNISNNKLQKYVKSYFFALFRNCFLNAELGNGRALSCNRKMIKKCEDENPRKLDISDSKNLPIAISDVFMTTFVIYKYIFLRYYNICNLPINISFFIITKSITY